MGHCLIGGRVFNNPECGQAHALGFCLSGRPARCTCGICVGICRTALVFPASLGLPEAVSEAPAGFSLPGFYFSFPCTGCWSYVCTYVLACRQLQSVAPGGARLRAQLKFSSVHFCTSEAGDGGGRFSSARASPQDSRHAGEPCPSSVPSPPGLFRASRRPTHDILCWITVVPVV